ncbi:MAG: methyltransferase domain-containing protein [Gammaproteobacteria bacterium]|nr:methyltransferase domain-containing protein [Gammaproteobacteria bacterium]
MSQPAERDYILGTNDEEIRRLGLQHRVWRPAVLDCWQRAGITVGSRVLDVGAGPGYATVDLAEIVGETGQVIAVERSRRFARAARDRCESQGLRQVQLLELDLMTDPVPAEDMDAAWCRWVASFVSSPALLLSKLARAVRPGGVAIFHEYVDYSTFRLAPRSPAVEAFVQRVGDSWRASGGEPDVALALPSVLTQTGFRVRSATPKIFCVRPSDYVWQWPASFIDINLKRMLELGQVDETWAAMVRHEFDTAGSNPDSLMFTPMVLEIVAQRTANPQLGR